MNIPDDKATKRMFGFSLERGRSTEMFHSKQRHATRDPAVGQSIDILSHAVVSPYRINCEGGTWPTRPCTKQQPRLGTAETGHGRRYIITDFYQKFHTPQVSETFESDLKEYPKSYNLKRTELVRLMNAMPQMRELIRAKYRQDLYKGCAGKPSGA